MTPSPVPFSSSFQSEASNQNANVPPSMHISLKMDVRTSGTHEGLFISTGLMTTSQSQDVAKIAWPVWPPSGFNRNVTSTHPNEYSAAAIDQVQESTNAIAYGQEGSSTMATADAELQLEQRQMEAKEGQQNAIDQNVLMPMDRTIGTPEDWRFPGNGVDIDRNGGEMARKMDRAGWRPSRPTAFQVPSTSAIQLNVFDEDDNHKHTTRLVPLAAPFRGIQANQQQSSMSTPKWSNGELMAGGPLLCDSKTTTTTVEVFRTNSAADFVQIPRGPLSSAKDGVHLVPVLGPEYERTEKSETQFSEDIVRPRGRRQSPMGSRSVQWGDSLPIPADATPPYDVAAPSSIGPFSPPQQASTPIPIVTSPSSEEVPPMFASSPPAELTILRRQQQERCERRLIGGEAECPPRPPKKWTAKGRGGQNQNQVPPRPPKPAHLMMRGRSDAIDAGARERSRSVGNGLQRAERRPMRSASSNEIFKLYQTRDCLGRVVCEW